MDAGTYLHCPCVLLLSMKDPRTLRDAIEHLKNAMAILAQEFTYPSQEGFDGNLSAVYSSIGQAQYDLHAVMDRMENPEAAYRKPVTKEINEQSIEHPQETRRLPD